MIGLVLHPPDGERQGLRTTLHRGIGAARDSGRLVLGAAAAADRQRRFCWSRQAWPALLGRDVIIPKHLMAEINEVRWPGG